MPNHIHDVSSEDRASVNLALGRLFRIMSRPEQPGDVDEYHRCHSVIMDLVGGDMPPDYRPNYTRDRLLGAAGDP